MYIELHRTFRELRPHGHADDSTALIEGGQTLTLPELLQEQRVVVLSEGGSGKTCELQEAVQRLRNEGKTAFFLRLEHVVSGFDSAFDEGDIHEFHAWLASAEPGWLLLDSIDESRLRSPQQFEAAMRVINAQLARAKDRTYLLVSGRPSAWRPKTDLDLCTRLFPVAEERSELQSNDLISSYRTTTNTSAAGNVFKVVALESLSSVQVEAFATAKGITNPKLFLDAIERGDAWSFAQRPQDLEDLVEYWKFNGKLGSRLEWMTASVDRRLQETQDRAEARPLTPARAREGVEKLAMALILTRQQNISVPDGPRSAKGLNACLVLGWNESEIVTLLQRPLFDQDIYGTVRFHHRSVLEYLAAQCFLRLLQREVSRRKLEELFFREQYGLQVVVPSLRPLLPWLAMADSRILERVRRVAPEIVFEGGDPQRFPVEMRASILEQVCKHYAAGSSAQSLGNPDAIQRFAAPDVSDTVRRLIDIYRQHEQVIPFLMRMVWQGDIVQALPEVMQVAHAVDTPLYGRIAAFHAVDAIGKDSDMATVRGCFAQEGDGLNRKCMAALVSLVHEPSSTTLQWIMDCLPRLAEFNKNDSTGLSRELVNFFERANTALCAQAIDKIHTLLIEPPVIDKHRYNVSIRYQWLRWPAGCVVSRLIKARDIAALGPSAVAELHMLAQNEFDGSDPYEVQKLDLPQLVQGWPAVKWIWLWHNIEMLRTKGPEGTKRIVDPWLAWTYMHSISWDEDDFALAIAALTQRPLADDKLVALEVAFRQYVRGGRQPIHLQQMEQAASVNTALHERLHELLHPPAVDETKDSWERDTANWNLRAKQQTEKQLQKRREAVEILAAQLDTLRDPGYENSSDVSRSQAYLLEQMRKAEEGKGSHWSQGQWRSLEAEFGVETARAFRDGIVAYWRKHSPKLISEGAELSNIPQSDLFGLTGLTIDAAETPRLMTTLSTAEACVAFRYAMREMNGFPHWFEDLCTAHPEVVIEMALTEVEFELDMETVESTTHYLIADIRNVGGWLGNRLAHQLMRLLQTQKFKRNELLEHLVDIVLASEVSDTDISTLASGLISGAEPDHHPLWAAVWTSVDPGPAIDAVQNYLKVLSTTQERTAFIMPFASHLMGRNSHASRMRTRYQTPAVLKRLYILIHEHVRVEEDIDRMGKGVYSPALRDSAQEAREMLARTLGKIPGQEAFLALQAISQEHPRPDWRPWFVQQAVAKAQLDSERLPWNEKQVNEFATTYERAPAHHSEMFDLAVMRLLDLKLQLEDSDQSTASIVIRAELETELRHWIAVWCTTHAHGRFTIPQEHELPDAKRPDMLWTCANIEGAVPVELKIADRWSGSQLLERLENQLAGDYLRDEASSRGIFLLVWRGVNRKRWRLHGGRLVTFSQLIDALQAHWKCVSTMHPKVEEIKIIGIDLTKRAGGLH